MWSGMRPEWDLNEQFTELKSLNSKFASYATFTEQAFVASLQFPRETLNVAIRQAETSNPKKTGQTLRRPKAYVDPAIFMNHLMPNDE